MTTDGIVRVVRSLTRREQDAVLQFIEYLRGTHAETAGESPFVRAADDFIAQHPELLQRLAQ